jgi:hypothetical protein
VRLYQGTTSQAAEKVGLDPSLKGRTFRCAVQALYFCSFLMGFSPGGICFGDFFRRNVLCRRLKPARVDE